MSDYRRYFVAGGTYFFTITTYRRRPLFANQRNVQLLRTALREVKKELPFDINAAVVLPDHMHFLWTLPAGDSAYSKRIGLMKTNFTRDFYGAVAAPRNLSTSRQRRHESDVWQRRFWEHLIRDEHDFDRHFDYIHYNPVKHGVVSCPHVWEATSFHYWVRKNVYERTWVCSCDARRSPSLNFSDIQASIGE